MTVQLNEEQQKAVDLILQTADSRGHMALIGPAGTGKSTTISKACDLLAKQRPSSYVLMLGPTHKACQQLRKQALPKNVRVWTVQKFCKVKAEQWRDEDVFSIPTDKSRQIAESIGDVCMVIVDESSMLQHEQAQKVKAATTAAGVGVCFCGDPYQLPPVKTATSANDQLDIESDGLEIVEQDLANEFIAAPIKAVLDKVMRHDGPILQQATEIRRRFDEMQTFPSRSIIGQDSKIIVEKRLSEHFCSATKRLYETLLDKRITNAEFHAASPRLLAYRNDSVDYISHQLRQSLYGKAALSSWVEGEIIMFPAYTKPVQGPNYFIYSCSEALIVKAEKEYISINEGIHTWMTPKLNLPRECELKIEGEFQKLTVNVFGERKGGDDSYVVYTPLIGDKEIHMQYNRIKEGLLKSNAKPQDNAWKITKRIRDTYFSKVSSAFVMTVHKSQGSTFKTVYVHRDLLSPMDLRTRNSLLYVATTRASKTVVYGGGRG